MLDCTRAPELRPEAAVWEGVLPPIYLVCAGIDM